MPEEALAGLCAQASSQLDPVVVGLEALMEGLDLHPLAGTSVTGFTSN
ncbi:hypothetical protein [Deinococcus sp.]|nr:hypothetical protein [Deinococcus sp.]